MSEIDDQRNNSEFGFDISAYQALDLLESISEAFYGVDSDWRFIYLNRKAEQLWNRKREGLIGKNIWEEFPHGVNTQAYREMHRALDEQITIRFETFSAFLDAWVEVEVFPTRNGLSIYFHDMTRRKQAEIALENSQKQLRLITDSLPVMVSYVDAEMRYQFINRSYEEWFGLKQEQVVGKHVSEVIGQAEFEAAKPALEAALNGEVFYTEHELPSAAGLRHIRRQITPYRIEDGTVAGFVAMVDDVTERKRSEEGLGRLAAIVSSSNDSIISMTLDGNITSWNRGAEVIFGYSADEAFQKSIAMLIPPDKLGEEIMLVGKVVAGETVKNYDTIRWKKDGSEVFVSVSLSPLKDGQGKIIGVSKISQDITQRKQSEEALRRSGERLAAINRLDQIISSNLDLSRVYDNFVKELQALMSLDRTAIVRLNEAGDHWQVVRQWTRQQSAILVGEWRSVQGSAIELLVSSRVPYSEPEVGEPVEWTETASLKQEGIRSRLLLPLILQDQVVGVLTVGSRQPSAFSEEDQSLLRTFADQLAIAVQNATLYEQIKQQAAELEQHVTERTAQLEASNKELEAFTYSVSHDLRAPLRAIDGSARILLRDYAAQLPESAQRYLHLIRDNSQQMGTLIDDLLTFSRVNRQPLVKQSVNIGSLVRAILEDLRDQQGDRQIEAVIGDLPQCQADPALLKQVLVNLLSNAIKFTGQRTVARIEIEYQKVDGQRVYTVKDNGAGFDMAYADKLFGVFQRLHRSDEFPGTGVGLAIVQRIIHRHGGLIWAHAEADKGATFYFTLAQDGGAAHD